MVVWVINEAVWNGDNFDTISPVFACKTLKGARNMLEAKVSLKVYGEGYQYVDGNVNYAVLDGENKTILYNIGKAPLLND